LGNTLLITFGCSWTYGVAVNYTPGMSREDLDRDKLNQDLCNTLSWRGVLCKRHGIANHNFARGGSSNQRQFRLAQEFFGSAKYQELRNQSDRIIVLWGITSTARNELWSLEHSDYHNFFLTDSNDAFANFMVRHSYDHDAEVYELRNRMLFWNRFFDSQGIVNLWFDTFNTHNYDHDFLGSEQRSYRAQARDHLSQSHYDAVAGPDWPSYSDFVSRNFSQVPANIQQEIHSIFGDYINGVEFPQQLEWHQRELKPIVNLIDHDRFPRDLMSWLMQQKGIAVDHSQQDFHHSEWKIDRGSMQHLVDLGLLNPHSFHPTREAHAMMADFFSERLRGVLE
jgi:hypothetical protein